MRELKKIEAQELTQELVQELVQERDKNIYAQKRYLKDQIGKNFF